MTITRPLRLITLHFSQIGFTEGLTFISSLLFPFLYARAAVHHISVSVLFETISYTATSQVVRCKLNRDLVARQDANEIHADLA